MTLKKTGSSTLPLTRRTFLERFGMVGGSALVMSAMQQWELLGAQAGRDRRFPASRRTRL
jgi:hypothetical protein